MLLEHLSQLPQQSIIEKVIQSPSMHRHDWRVHRTTCSTPSWPSTLQIYVIVFESAKNEIAASSHYIV